MTRWFVGLLAVTSLACGDADAPDGGKRVTLTARNAAVYGEGWDVTNGRVTPDQTDSTFYLRATMVVGLVPTNSGDAFCRQQPAAGAPAFARVEDVSGDASTCTMFTSAELGGNFAHSDSAWAGQGYLLRDGAAVNRAKLLIVADYGIGADVGVTFDIVGL